KCTDTGMAVGTKGPDGFHWRNVTATGPKPRSGKCISVGIVEGSSAIYVVLIEDNYSLPERSYLRDNILYRCDLDLNTMEWTRTEIIDAAAIENQGWRFDYCHMRILATRSKLQIFSVFDDQNHALIDRATHRCSIVEYDNNTSLNLYEKQVFVAQNTLFSIINVFDAKRSSTNIYRYEEDLNEWEKVRFVGSEDLEST
ncbi:hypothetical protein PENTCL1PPCAC_21014, partial [Pristionchus entomophagus]